MDDFEMKRNRAEAEGDAFDFSLMDANGRRAAVDNGGSDAGFYLDEEKSPWIRPEKPKQPAEAYFVRPEQLEDDREEASAAEMEAYGQKRRLLVVVAILLGILAVMLSGMLYWVSRNDGAGQMPEERVVSTTYDAAGTSSPSITISISE